MARLQILELPEGTNDDRPPFVLVIDQCEGVTLDVVNAIESHWKRVGEQIGARGTLIFTEAIDIPAYLSSEQSAADRISVHIEGDAEENIRRSVEYIKRQHGTDGTKVRDKDQELRAANEWIERLEAETGEARAALDRVRNLHRPAEHGGITICAECSGWDGSTTDNSPCGYEHCPTLRALAGNHPAPAA
jgi:hypothetical protein